MIDSPAPCSVLLVCPRFNVASFWNYQATCEAAGAKYPAAPLGLITVAALLPKTWTLKFVDRNTQELTLEDIRAADLVMTGGMLPQQFDILDVVRLAQGCGKPVVVGGPDVTSSPHLYDLADFRVLGEAEGIIDAFVAAWDAGIRSGVFEAEKFKTDVTTSPTPRFDLLRFSDYLHVGVQFSRGCPFNCEFCDIIELYGRMPRTKTTPQMLAELDALYRLGYRGHVDFVDDNLIGNKKALRLFLPHLIAWQKKHGFPFEFSTEASLNLADDEELLAQMRRANFFTLFTGIESPDTATLIGAQKKQNTRRDIGDSVRRINAAGMSVAAGFILGFDEERGSISDAMIECIEDTSITVCMVGLLFALPNTQLTRRLARERRLYENFDMGAVSVFGDQCTSGLNFVTKRPRRQILSDYLEVLQAIYRPASFFERVRRTACILDTNARTAPADGDAGPSSLRLSWLDLRRTAGLIWYASRRHPIMVLHFWRSLVHVALRNPAGLRYVVLMLGIMLHLGPFSRHVMRIIRDQIDMIDRGEWVAPPIVDMRSIPGAEQAPLALTAS